MLVCGAVRVQRRGTDLIKALHDGWSRASQHADVVEVSIELNVARSPEEAELQATGKSIQELAAEEEAAAEFEIAELFDDIGSAASDDDAAGSDSNV